ASAPVLARRARAQLSTSPAITAITSAPTSSPWGVRARVAISAPAKRKRTSGATRFRAPLAPGSASAAGDGWGNSMTDVWRAFSGGLDIGDNLGGQIRNANAFREGGLDAVAEAAGQVGDLQTMEGARGMVRRQRQFEDDERQRA